ncbi:MAG TPA: hypothetical protein VGR37_04460 [Longimicrobiaceae bacterium]|nr:hypothetical protein [Longimicrobiaceae bacterium]
MDWFEILLVIIFFGAPLLGRIFKPDPPQETLPPVETEGYGEQPARIPAPAEARQGAQAPVPATADGGWSAGWGAWPGMETEEDEEEYAPEAERGTALRPADPEGIHTVEAVSLEPVSPVLYERPLPAQVPVSLELAQVDRKAEHARLHARFAKPAAAPRPRPDRLADHLRSRTELRRAILLAEALGPPRSLQPLREER